jgi:16S rRNA (guanine1207-N2)-methyltransferase
LTRSQHIGPKLDDSDYTLTREVVATDEGLTFYSKPGIYGWQKVDVGSALLVAAMQQDLHADPSTPAPAILDLGCGYGYLAVMAALSTGGSVLATDNNMAAIIACEKNLRHHRITGCALADDCGASIVQSFDLVVCNPPFHQGFDTSRSITEKFLGAARQHLRPRGRAYFVVNRFIEIEARARHLFGSVEQIKCERGFKILRMQS